MICSMCKKEFEGWVADLYICNICANKNDSIVLNDTENSVIVKTSKIDEIIAEVKELQITSYDLKDSIILLMI